MFKIASRQQKMTNEKRTKKKPDDVEISTRYFERDKQATQSEQKERFVAN